MVKTKTEVKKLIEEYAIALSSVITVDKIILYGSYADGHPKEWSDIDIAVISRDFKGKDRFEIQEVLAEKHVGCSSYLEPIGYSLEEYENAHYLTFLGEIKRTGIVIYEAEKQDDS